MTKSPIDVPAIEAAKERYRLSQATEVGRSFFCPGCNTLVSKVSYQNVFCSNSGMGNCKDKYWNLVRRVPSVPKEKPVAYSKINRELVRLRPMLVAAINENKALREPNGRRDSQLSDLLAKVEEVINDPA